MSKQSDNHSSVQIRRLASAIILGTATPAAANTAERIAPAASRVASTVDGATN